MSSSINHANNRKISYKFADSEKKKVGVERVEEGRVNHRGIILCSFQYILNVNK